MTDTMSTIEQSLTALPLWTTIIIIGVGTYALRLSFIFLLGRLEFPPKAQRALRFVPAAVLAALVLPALVRPQDAIDLSPGNLHLLAGIVAALVAWRTRSMVATLATGMVALWILQAAIG